MEGKVYHLAGDVSHRKAMILCSGFGTIGGGGGGGGCGGLGFGLNLNTIASPQQMINFAF